MCGLTKTDVTIAIGYDHIDCPPKFLNPGKDKKIIHIDTIPSAVDEYFQPDVEIIGEISKTLQALANISKPRKSPPKYRTFRNLMLKELERYRNDKSFPLKPQRILSDLRNAIGEDDILVSDVGAHKLWLARMYPAYNPESLIISNGFAPVGYAIPASIGAKLARPEKNVVCACGDGGFLLNAQELETARRLKTPFVVAVWVDYSYGLIEWKQMNKFGSYFGVRFTNPDFVKYADSLGLPGFRISKADELLPTLTKALKQKLPSIVEIPVDYSENRRLAEDIG